MNLDEIALKHGTDKASSHHGYTRLYERYFADRPKVGALLELGWGGHEDPTAGGASARTWRDWLPKWDIFVVDNEEKQMVFPRDDGLLLMHTDQTDPGITDLAPFDIIIDDASHLSSLTIKSFELLWPHLKPGGWYVVEDTHMAYHSHYYGETEAHLNPSYGVHDLFAQDWGQTVTAMGFLKRLADEANFANRGEELDLFPEKYWLGYEVEEIHFHFNIVFVKKRG